ncbi:MAG: AAA family ATPase [Acidobacteria bacterium]|nr:AAA family ATPase [Acidobacteriota bacterium]
MLYAPRQTGKTSALLALRDLLNGGAEGDYRCVYVNVEAAQAMREDVGRATRIILGELASRARSAGDEFQYDAWPGILATFGEGALAEALTRWCEAASAPVVLLIDEIDSLIAPGTRRSSGARNPPAAGRLPSGGCDKVARGAPPGSTLRADARAERCRIRPGQAGQGRPRATAER